jgi:signal transduction histidine kinase
MLPHWALKIAPNRTADKSVEGSIFWVGGLILLLLVVSLIAGGLLLVRDAILQRQEALQKTSFVSNVSHELKTPLTSIRMYAELLADNKATKPDVMRQYLNVIVTESERLTRLVNNVLDFGRLEQKRRQYHCEPVKLPEFVMTVLETLKGVLEASEMSLEIKAEAESLVLADRDALNRVLVNLVDNACKYAADGKSILVTIGNGKKQAFIAVADRGPGIPSTHVKRIFERFFRVDDSVTATVGGSGLGLSIAQQLMHGMGGDLHWSPREGGGSVFTVTLPREDEG